MNHKNIFWQAFKALRYMFVPLVVLLFAISLFDEIGFNLVTLSESVKTYITLDEYSALYKLQESEARILWAITVLLYFATSIYFVTFGFNILTTSVTGNVRVIYICLIFICIIIELALLYSDMQQVKPSTVIFSFTYDILTASDYYNRSQLDTIRLILLAINSLALIVPMLCIITGCSIISYCETKKTHDVYMLAKSARNLFQLLNISSLMMVVGIIHMNVWLQWPATLVTDQIISKTSINFSSAISLYWGATYSLMIVAFYAPLTRCLHNQANLLITDCKDAAITSNPSQWLKENHLSSATIEQLPRIIIMLAPLLAGPVGGLLAGFVQ